MSPDYTKAPFRIDYSDPACHCRAGGMDRKTTCPLHGEKALRDALGLNQSSGTAEE